MAGSEWSVDGWKVQEILCIGRSGGVFRAVNEQGIVGALKVCFPIEGARAERALRELDALSNLRGKMVSNVAELLDAGHTRGRAGYFVVTAFVDGASLQAVLDEEVTLSLPTTVAMIRGLANGLAALHRMGIVHHAIKPPNILIPEADRFADATFIGLPCPGRLSTLTTNLPGEDGICGTPLYMAPELFAGRAMIDARTSGRWASCSLSACAVPLPSPVAASWDS